LSYGGDVRDYTRTIGCRAGRDLHGRMGSSCAERTGLWISNHLVND